MVAVVIYHLPIYLSEISQKHSNYIVNLGGAKAKDVLQLVQAVKESIKKKYRIDLEQEIQYLE